MSSLPIFPSISMRFRHIGVTAVDVPVMEAFYTDILGFTVTDRGHEMGMDIVFMSRDPADHHQIVLTSGRPPNLPNNIHNPTFGPVINQISFLLNSLDELRTIDDHLARTWPQGERIHGNHGNAWSIYMPDPEGNQVEFYVDTPWFCHQPMMAPLDLSVDDDAILRETETLARSGRGFRTQAQWRQDIASVMAERN